MALPYDLRALFLDGREVVQTDLDVCANISWTVNVPNRSGLRTRLEESVPLQSNSSGHSLEWIEKTIPNRESSVAKTGSGIATDISG